MNFWETKEWILAKTIVLRTEKLLNRTEYLHLVGYKNYSEEHYQKYLEAMKNTDSLQNTQELQDNFKFE